MCGMYFSPCHNGEMIFGRKPVFDACPKTVFEVKEEIPDGLPVLFYTRDVESF
jgi:hypothetical protein